MSYTAPIAEKCDLIFWAKKNALDKHARNLLFAHSLLRRCLQDNTLAPEKTKRSAAIAY